MLTKKEKLKNFSFFVFNVVLILKNIKKHIKNQVINTEIAHKRSKTHKNNTD